MKPFSFKVCGNCNHYSLRLSQEDLAFIEETMSECSIEILKEWTRGRVFRPGRRTKDPLYVQERLGHRSILSTMVYTHLVKFETDDYHVKVARTLEEDKELLEAGFEYVTEREDLKLYRKRK